ncbi:DEKNAAC105674 [Brettanomyces naardenensis]|uniref:DEKNAAC105674 n=1 Tax=Brettanomyces naardenensis TaxID=13370 RepID=A0A448YU09_BRENA|nr:DEKNAAC105674 [Brettanomyces naardenensis]
MVTNDSVVAKSLELGAREFRSRNYSKALKIFARGIEVAERKHKEQQDSSSTPEYYVQYQNLLDSRAACFMSLNRLDMALKDSEKLIKIYPYRTKGYLRKCDVLGRSGHELRAFQCIDKGFQRIRRYSLRHQDKLSVNERLFKKMEAERSRLAEKLGLEIVVDADGKEHKRRKYVSLDPMTRLPLEVSILILDSIGQRELLNLMMVSSTWYKVIRSMARFMKCPLLIPNINRRQFDKFVRFCASCTTDRQIGSLLLDCSPPDEQYILTQLVNSKINVRRLRIRSRGLSNQVLVKLLNTSSVARRFFNDVEELYMDLHIIDDGNGLNTLLQYLRNASVVLLNVFELTTSMNVKRVDQTESVLKIANFDLRLHPALNLKNNRILMNNLFHNASFSSLKSISLADCNVNLEDLRRVLTSGLLNLRLERIPSLTFRGLAETLHDTHIRLKELRFTEEGGQGRDPEDLRQANFDLSFLCDVNLLELSNTSLTASACSKIIQATGDNLIVLRLTANGHLAFGPGPLFQYAPTSIFDFQQLVNDCPKLKELALSRCSNLDNRSLKKLVTEMNLQGQPKSLAVLDLSFSDINGLGLIALFDTWLRLRILKVYGCDISDETIQYAEGKGFVDRIWCESTHSEVLRSIAISR